MASGSAVRSPYRTAVNRRRPRSRSPSDSNSFQERRLAQYLSGALPCQLVIVSQGVAEEVDVEVPVHEEAWADPEVAGAFREVDEGARRRLGVEPRLVVLPRVDVEAGPHGPGDEGRSRAGTAGDDVDALGPHGR